MDKITRYKNETIKTSKKMGRYFSEKGVDRAF